MQWEAKTMGEALIEKPCDAVALPPLSPKAIAMLPKIEELATSYIQEKKKNEELISLIDFAYEKLGVCKSTLYNWSERAKDGDDRYAPALHAFKKITDLCELQLTRKVHKSNASGSMFLLKAMHGYRERDEASANAGGNITIVINTGVPTPCASMSTPSVGSASIGDSQAQVIDVQASEA